MTEKEEPKSFEESYGRLEAILEKMNAGKASLDDSLKLYEEADLLIASCQKRLTEAERKIETLIKTKSGELLLDEKGAPVMQGFP